MSHSNLILPLALVAGLLALVAAPVTAEAQQAYAYQNIFDSNANLNLTGMWAVDNTPAVANASGAASGNNLNYNDGVDFDNGAANSGTARTPSINLSGLSAANQATMSFWCRYQTETTGTSYDQRWIRIYNATTNAQVYQGQFAGTAAAPLTCPAMNQWHQHTFSSMPAGTFGIPIIVEFYFNSVDAGINNYQGWFIDDLVIIAADTTPPALITDLAASNPTLTGMTLDWSAPFDDDISGVASSYDLRFSTNPITDANFAQATTVTGEPQPGVPGSPHSVNVTGLNPGTTYYFAIRTTDVAGNQSANSNIATLATSAPAPVGGSATPGAPPPKDRYNACAAGTTSAPMGILVLGTLVALAAAARLIARK